SRPAPAPAPVSTSTSCPSLMSVATPDSVRATRRSAGLFSLMRPMRMMVLPEAECRLQGAGSDGVAVEGPHDGPGDEPDLGLGGDEGRADLQRVVVDGADQHAGVGARLGDLVAADVLAELDAGHERVTGPDLGDEVVCAQRLDRLLQHGLQVRGALNEVLLL